MDNKSVLYNLGGFATIKQMMFEQRCIYVFIFNIFYLKSNLYPFFHLLITFPL